MSSPRAFITGITGQDGSYLAELLLAKGYEVHGAVREPAVESRRRIEDLSGAITLHEADLLDRPSLTAALRAADPSEVYNLAGISFVAGSWDDPAGITEVNALGPLHLLEAIRQVCPQARFCQASSAEIFGDAPESPQTEESPLRPRTPYGAAKAHAHLMTGAYRRRRGLHASSAILFNHESERRGLEFVTRKITWHAAAIAQGHERGLTLGDLDAERDWGYAPDYVKGMWLMLQRDDPDDYVIATGRSHSVRECCEVAFDEAGIGSYEPYVVSDPAFVRPRESTPLVGNPAKAKQELGWKPKTSFEEMIRRMVRADIESLAQGR